MVGARLAVLVVPAAIYFFSNVHRVAPGVVATDLMKAFSITAASLGGLAAIYPYVFVVMALVGGSLVETLGARLTIASGAILDAKWAGLEAGGVRIYPEAGYRTAFGVCLAVAAGSLVMTLLVTETRCRNIWRRATH